MDANSLWDEIKKHSGWENEIVADLKAEQTDIHGVYEVKSGDTLSKISKTFLGDPNRYQEIFKLNTDQLKGSEHDQGRPEAQDSQQVTAF